MSNLIINIRILMWHFQVTGNWRFSLKYNDAHKELKNGWFAIYRFKIFKNK